MYSAISSTDTYLRPYQQEAKDNIFKSWDKVNSVMLQMPTGTGKTVLFSSIIKDIHNWMIQTKEVKKVLIIVHRTELIEQTRDKLGTQYHVASGTIAGNYDRDLRPQVQIASIQTLTHPSNQFLAQKLDVGFIIIDEAHHALAASYQKLWDLYPEAKKLGVTATPWRMNHAGFTDLFDMLVQSWPIKKFIDQKYLAKFKYYSIRPTSAEQLAIDGIKEFDIEGDYKVSALEDAMDTGRIRANLLQSYQKYAKGKRGIIYAISRTHGKKICSDYQAAGINIDYIDSNTKPKDRKDKVDKFRRGEIEVLVNVDIFSEGFDCPALDFVQMARPTQSLVKYLQQVGRALRPNGRKQAIILDNVGMFKRFGLPDANRKWAHHFKGMTVEESISDDEQSSAEYTNTLRRFKDYGEGSEEMVLLNGKSLKEEPVTIEDPVIAEDNEPIVVSKPSMVEQMVKTLDYLGIKHGQVTTSKGLFFDLLETEDSYVYRQISIKFKFRNVKLLSIPKDSVLGRLCKEFGSCFSLNLQVKKNGKIFFEKGRSFNLGGLELWINDSLQLCKEYNEQNKPYSFYELTEDDYDISLFNEYLQKLINVKPNPAIKHEFDKLASSGAIDTKQYFYLGENAYMLLIFDSKLTIKQVTIREDCVHFITVSKADKDTSLYKSCKKHGADAIKYIKHYGGYFTTIMFEAEDNSGIYINSYDGETMSCYYDFELENKYMYAKSIGCESAEDKYTVLEFKKTQEESNKSEEVHVDNLQVDIPNSFLCFYKITEDKFAHGFYDMEHNTFMLSRGSCFPAKVDYFFPYRKEWEDLVKSGCELKGDYYELKQYYAFSSIKIATSVIRGYETESLHFWDVLNAKNSRGKLINGKNLQQILELINQGKKIVVIN